MTSTERLSSMLDERGIEYDDESYLGSVFWGNASYEQIGDDYTRLIVEDATPEQAIAATVGNGTDLSKRLREVTGLHAFAELFGFSWTDGSDWDWHDVACAMADAIDATVGVGTCEGSFHKSSDLSSGRVPLYYCKGTNKSIFMEREARFCPLCGERIEEEAE